MKHTEPAGTQPFEAGDIRQLLQRVAALFPDRREPVWLYVPKTDAFFLSDHGAALLGIPQDSALDAVDLGALCLQADRTRYTSLLEEMRTGDAPAVDALIRFPVRSGRLSQFRLTGTRVGVISPTVLYTGILMEEEGSRRELEARRQALSDPLTSLPARNLFLYRVSVWIADWDNVHVGWMGTLHINRYRRMRYLYGESRLDHLVQVVAGRLAAFRPELEISRATGEEFLLAWHGPSAGFSAEALGRAVMDLFREPCDMGNAMMTVSVSLGYTVFGAGAQADQVLLASESALQEALLAGGDCMRAYSDQDVANVLRRISLEEALHQEWNTDTVHQVYQPIFDLEANRIIGVEALARWNSAAKGTVSPGEFIPIAEESGLIVPLGYRILRDACMAGVVLNAGGRKMTVSVNASARQLAQPEFADRVMETLEWSGLPPERLQIEVTESLLLQDEQRTSGVLADLQRKGIRVALDDFGTGYSSLSYLKRLPLNVLKIDRSFVVNLVENRMEKAIARSIISLSNILGLDVVAEGVETKEQLQALRAIGCSWIQGYYTGRPQTLDQLLGQLARDASAGGRDELTMTEQEQT
jgi:predicted signal transduction protein with EAL and GGDEF domain